MLHRTARSIFVHGAQCLFALALVLPAIDCGTPFAEPQSGAPIQEALRLRNVAFSVVGRDNWIPPGASRLLRITARQDIIPQGTVPVVTFSPGPVMVNYVVVASPRDVLISIAIPVNAQPGFQVLSITAGTVSAKVDQAINVVDTVLPNPTRSVVPPGASATLTFAPISLFAGQTSFDLNLGSDVKVTALDLLPDGSLSASIQVLPQATPGSRSIHLTAGSHYLVADRGFAVDFGSLSESIHLDTPGGDVKSLDLNLPSGYTASVFAVGTPENGMLYPDEMYVDENNTLYVLNQEATIGPPQVPYPFSISVFDLNPDRYADFKAFYKDIDTAHLGGLLESATMLPVFPDHLFVSTEDFPFWGFGGGRTVYKVDRNTGESRLFWWSPEWNLDPLGTDLRGNLVLGLSGYTADAMAVGVMNPTADFIRTCHLSGVFTDLLRLDPLTGKFILNRRNKTLGGSAMLNLDDCTTASYSDGPQFDEGSFAPEGGDFGNGFFVAREKVPFTSSTYGNSLVALVPASAGELPGSEPQRATVFAKGFAAADSVWFDRDGHHMLVADILANAVVDIHSTQNGGAPGK